MKKLALVLCAICTIALAGCSGNGDASQPVPISSTPSQEPIIPAVPSESEYSSPAPSEEPPITDPQTPAEIAKFCEEDVRGMSEGQAMREAAAIGAEVRVAKRDGVDFPMTMDYRFSRINLEITAGTVSDCVVG